MRQQDRDLTRGRGLERNFDPPAVPRKVAVAVWALVVLVVTLGPGYFCSDPDTIDQRITKPLNSHVSDGPRPRGATTNIT